MYELTMARTGSAPRTADGRITTGKPQTTTTPTLRIYNSTNINTTISSSGSITTTPAMPRCTIRA